MKVSNILHKPTVFKINRNLYKIIASYPVHDATTNSIMWQGCQTFGFLFVLAMDLLRDPDGSPKNNMHRALILQAGLAGAMMILSLLFRGRMLRTEAIEKLKQEELNEKEIECNCRNNQDIDLENNSNII